MQADPALQPQLGRGVRPRALNGLLDHNALLAPSPLIELLPVAAYACDAAGRILWFNHRAADLWGRAPRIGDDTEVFCGSHRLYFGGRLITREEAPMAVALRTGEAVHGAEGIVERPDGSKVWATVHIEPVKDAAGRLLGAINCFHDTTDRKNSEQRQELLADELSHRIKNLLAVVQTIATRSLSGSRSIAEARDALAQRIQALGRSQALLISGAFQGASLSEIIRLELEAFSDRVQAVGSDVMLNAKAVQTFALLLHELATNAAKHGALSTAQGRVAISWSVVRQDGVAQFKFEWLERDGPPVAKPRRQGFGRILIEKAAAQEFNAIPKLRFEPEGLAYEFEAPLSALAREAGPADMTGL